MLSVHYEPESANAVAAIHEDYEVLSAKAISDYGVVIAVQNLADVMLVKALRGDFNFSSVHASAAATEASAAQVVVGWSALSRRSEEVLPTLPRRTQQMFTGHCLTQQYLLGNGTLALQHLTASVLASSVADTVIAVERAVAAMEDACDALQLGEGGGHWQGYFAHDRLVDFQHSRRLLMQLASALSRTPVPPTRPICSCTGGVYNCTGSVPYAQCPDMFANQLPAVCEYTSNPHRRLIRRDISSLRRRL